MESYLDDKVDFSKVRRVLVVKLQHLGDVLLTSPLFVVLKKRYPYLEIDALVFAETAPMLAGNPYIEKIHCIDREWKKYPGLKLSRELALFGALKARDYHLLIALTDRMRGALLARLLKPIYSVAQKYPHKRGALWRQSFTHVYSVPSTPRHTVETHLDALRRIGVYPQGSEKKLLFAAGQEAEEKVALLCRTLHLQTGNYIVVHPTSRWMFKSWAIDGFAEVLRALAEQGVRAVLVSGPAQAERSYARTILERSGRDCTDLTGQLSLQELAALIAGACCFIGLDSVAMHLAAAVGTPCVALFGPSNDKVWAPWMVAHRVIASSHSCRPCNLDGCGNGKVSDCLQAINPDAVLSGVSALLEETRH